jgi:hypothetical protein
MLVQMQAPLEVSLDQYLDWANRAEAPRFLANALLGRLSRQLTNAQCFSIEKQGEIARDSRDPQALAAELSILSGDRLAGTDRWRFRIRVRNVGQGAWRTESGGTGQVNLGVQLVGPDGEVSNRDFLRISLGAPNVEVGQDRTLEFDVGLPHEEQQSLRFDLVSEMVCWFSELRGGVAVDWSWSASA